MKTLSMFGYYGGKAKLAPVICDILDYANTNIYIEPFGGACRTLLNKPRHYTEIYNDSSAGLCAFVEMMSNKDTAYELIRRLYDTEYSPEQFEWALNLRNSVDDPIWKQVKSDYNKIKEKVNNNPQGLTRDELYIKKNYNLLKKLYSSGKDIKYIPYVPSSMDLAVATYIIYTQSRDCMGKDWSRNKYKSLDDYHKSIHKLYDVAERLEGVIVCQTSATVMLENYLENENVCCYADPSYLDPDTNVDLGNNVYKHQSTYKDHEAFLDLVANATCKMVISNYDSELYRTKLSHWNRIEIPVKTTVGGIKNNKRLEVIWYNYQI